MISKSANHNVNYLAKIIKVQCLRKHSNADKLQVLTVDFQNVITGLDTKDGDICVFFPLESKINTNFLSETNSFRDKDLNKDKDVAGFFEKTGRVRAVKLRGEKSMGYIVPVSTIEKFTSKNISEYVGEEFDTVGNILMVEKYIIPHKEPFIKQGKKPRISRLVEGQVHLHVDTENLRRNAHKISPDDTVSITYKLHGTSFWVANVPCKRKLNLAYKVLKWLGVKIQETEYDYVYGSRRVVKNEYETQDTNDYYDSDLWTELKDKVKDFIPKNYAFYGECVGYTAGGKAIQAKYDYGCATGVNDIYIYRITFTNADGLVRDLSTDEIRAWSESCGFKYVPHFYTGKASELFKDLNPKEHWNEDFIKALEEKYNEKDCFMCKNVVPEEGIVLRKEGAAQFESYKLKSFRYLEYETEMMDKGEEDIESQEN